jgi:hypothetical protein
MDSNTLDECFNGITAYESRGDILSKLVKINAHSYFGSAGSRTSLATFRMENGIRHWQSESGPLNMSGSTEELVMAMASRIIRDLREMKCEAWIDWQLAADQSPVWGIIVGKYSEITHPTAKGEAYYIRSQFSRFIKPGYSIIDCRNPNTLAALSPDESELVLVVCNETTADAVHSFDLGAFKTAGPAIERFRSGKVNDSYTEKLTRTTLNLTGSLLEYTAPRYSVTTFIIPVEKAARPLTGGRYTFRNKACNQFVGIEGSSLTAGGYLVITGDSPQANSQFDLTGDRIRGGYIIRPAHIAPSKNFVLDVEGVSNSDRAKIMQYTDWGGENQRFHFVNIEGDYYKVIIRKSMKCWSIPDNNYDIGTPVMQMTWDQADNSVWEIRKLPSSVSVAELRTALNINYLASTLNISSTDDNKLNDLYILNVLGQTIKYVHNIDKSQCSVSIDMNPGIYFIRATMIDGITANRKFVRL